MRVNQRGFSMLAALSLAVVLGVGFMFLGKIVAQVKASRARAQARISSLGYEDAIIELAVRQLRNVGCQGIDADNLNGAGDRLIPGTQVALTFVPLPGGLIFDGNSQTIFLGAVINQDIPDTGNPNFIDNRSNIQLRIDFLNRRASQDEKIFNGGPNCAAFWVQPAEDRQLKVTYEISWRFKERPQVIRGTKLITLVEIGM